ncbi:3-dehydroquinate synthase [Sporotomaculum syntrophicum]|uniref:3-dehydroquinate synthase n=1 Tax=Sporotomaculum syntrophicum TaxID=182264 RepID=A0A9D2WSJ1_9FIRM|nr:3-dehydroquinate synthase [Sporotomaculum syntrophicum]KAF1086584.1 3-dehydroquinate synthase [Sporotomaculum syntrophicum]
MSEVEINLGSRSYRIMIGSSLLDRAGELIAGLPVGRQVLLVTNTTVGPLYAGRVAASLEGAGLTVTVAEVPDGEQYKSLASTELLYERAFSAGLDRRSAVVALGGGVVGDLAGFVAATYMRGVPFVQLPTTLLAQVDSSVGGKVAVNHPRGKNIIGAFYQPSLVIADTDTLSTLNNRELRSGLAEVIKYGIIGDEQFFTWLEQNLPQVLALKPEALAYVIEQSCSNKARVVEEDETEQGARALLNLGHTAGHAIEALAGFGRYTHGEAVAMGTAVATQLGVQLGRLTLAAADRITGLLRRAGLPTTVPAELAGADLVAAMHGDKKTVGGAITFILPVKIGQAVIHPNTAEEHISRAIVAART